MRRGKLCTAAQRAAIRAAVEANRTAKEMFDDPEFQAVMGNRTYFSIARLRRRVELAIARERGVAAGPKMVRLSRGVHELVNVFVILESESKARMLGDIVAAWNKLADGWNSEFAAVNLPLPHITEAIVAHAQKQAGLKMTWKETYQLNWDRGRKLTHREKAWRRKETSAQRQHEQLKAARDRFLEDAERRGWEPCEDPEEVLGTRMEHCDDCDELFPALPQWFRKAQTSKKTGNPYFLMDRCLPCRRLHEVFVARERAKGTDPIRLKLDERIRHREVLERRAQRKKRHAHIRSEKARGESPYPETRECTKCHLLWVLDPEYIRHSTPTSKSYKQICSFCEDEGIRRRKHGYRSKERGQEDMR